jgi:hypothetical protein
MDKFKYPRTPHFPWSPGAMNDDRIIEESVLERLWQKAQMISVTVKMDGENTTVYPTGETHARSMDSLCHPSRTWMRAFAGRLCWDMKEVMGERTRMCGENMFARHSIPYENLDSYFLAFSIWEDQHCFSWGDTKSLIHNINENNPEDYLYTVPELYYGPPSGFDIRKFSEGFLDVFPDQEGFVVRNAAAFDMEDFGANVVKFVRKGHVQTDEHWMLKEVVPNRLKEHK